MQKIKCSNIYRMLVLDHNQSLNQLGMQLTHHIPAGLIAHGYLDTDQGLGR